MKGFADYFETYVMAFEPNYPYTLIVHGIACNKTAHDA